MIHQRRYKNIFAGGGTTLFGPQQTTGADYTTLDSTLKGQPVAGSSNTFQGTGMLKSYQNPGTSTQQSQAAGPSGGWNSYADTLSSGVGKTAQGLSAIPAAKQTYQDLKDPRYEFQSPDSVQGILANKGAYVGNLSAEEQEAYIKQAGQQGWRAEADKTAPVNSGIQSSISGFWGIDKQGTSGQLFGEVIGGLYGKYKGKKAGREGLARTKEEMQKQNELARNAETLEENLYGHLDTQYDFGGYLKTTIKNRKDYGGFIEMKDDTPMYNSRLINDSSNYYRNKVKELDVMNKFDKTLTKEQQAKNFKAINDYNKKIQFFENMLTDIPDKGRKDELNMDAPENVNQPYNRIKNISDPTKRLKKCGGKLYAEGGELLTNTYPLEFNAGGTHEQNPNDGIYQGINPSNNEPNLVEEGETRIGDYIFSQRLVVPKDLKDKGLPESIVGLDFAKASTYLTREGKERSNDPLSMKLSEDMLGRLSDLQEEIKAKKRQQDIKKQNNKFIDNVPNEVLIKNALEQPAQEQEVQEEMPDMGMQGFANGGKLYASGGNMKNSHNIMNTNLFADEYAPYDINNTLVKNADLKGTGLNFNFPTYSEEDFNNLPNEWKDRYASRLTTTKPGMTYGTPEFQPLGVGFNKALEAYSGSKTSSSNRTVNTGKTGSGNKATVKKQNAPSKLTGITNVNLGNPGQDVLNRGININNEDLNKSIENVNLGKNPVEDKSNFWDKYGKKGLNMLNNVHPDEWLRYAPLLENPDLTHAPIQASGSMDSVEFGFTPEYITEEEILNPIRDQFAGAAENIRNATAGNPGAYLANMQALNANFMKTLGEAKTKQKMVNNQLKLQESQINMQEELANSGIQGRNIQARKMFADQMSNRAEESRIERNLMRAKRLQDLGAIGTENMNRREAKEYSNAYLNTILAKTPEYQKQQILKG